MLVKSSLEYKDYYISVSDGEYSENIIVNFTCHSGKRSYQRKVSKETVLLSLQEKEAAEILDMHDKEEAVVKDYNRDISYAIQLYLEKSGITSQIIINVVTIVGNPDLRTFTGEKVILIKDAKQ